MTYLAYLQSQHTQQTIKSYLRILDHFLFHSKNKEESTYTDIINYLSEYKFRSSRVLAGIKKYFDYLYETGQRGDHPCKGFTIPRERNDIQFQELFTKEELELLLTRKERYAELELRNKCIISLLIYQGLTPANIENLEVKHLDLDEGTIYIQSTKVVAKRTLELKPKQVLMLFRYIRGERKKCLKKKTQALFLSSRGREYSVDTLNRMLRPLKGLFPHKNLNARTIRKSVITNWLNEDSIALDDVQLLSGQKWMSSTEKYQRPNADERRGKINEFWPF